MYVPKIWLLDPASTWVHKLFVFVGFRFPTMGGPILGDLSTLLFKPLSFPHRITTFLSQSGFSPLNVFSRITNPLFLIHFSYLQAKIGGGAMITSPYQYKWGSILSSQSGCFVGKGGSGIGIDSHLQKPARLRCSQRHYRAAECKVSPSNNTPNQVTSDREGLLEVFKLVRSHFNSQAQIGP